MRRLDWNGRLSVRLLTRRREGPIGHRIVANYPCHSEHTVNRFTTSVTSLGVLPEERRDALDLLDVRESVDQFGDVTRWIPTDQLRVDSLTTSMPICLLTIYPRSMAHALKYDGKYEAIMEGATEGTPRNINDSRQDNQFCATCVDRIGGARPFRNIVLHSFMGTGHCELWGQDNLSSLCCHALLTLFQHIGLATLSWTM